jgi:hypothetical protein
MVKLVRELERMEPSFVHQLYFSHLLINSNKREMTALTGELGLDARLMPENLLVKSPSGDIAYPFGLHDVMVGPEGPILFIYRGKANKGEEWNILITVGEPDPLPEWVENMEKLISNKGKINGTSI